MTLVLSNEEIESYLRMPECIETLADAQREFAALRAANRPRTDLYAPHEREDAFYVFKSFEGVLPKAGVVALRLNSDVIVMSEYQGEMRKDKQPLANGRWVGLILLFSPRRASRWPSCRMAWCSACGSAPPAGWRPDSWRDRMRRCTG